MGGQESGIAEDVEHILGGWHEERFALTDFDTIDVGFAPETDDDNKGIAMEIDLLSHLDYDAMNDEVGTVDEL